MTEINWDVYYDVCRHFPTHPKTYEFYAALTERYNFVKKVNDENVNTSGSYIDFSNKFTLQPSSGWTIRSDGISFLKSKIALTDAEIDQAWNELKVESDDSLGVQTQSAKLLNVISNIQNVTDNLTDVEKEQVREACLVLGIL